ncbi:hypothetical protein BDW72DRAFT_7233 [Aspergillus terricola var. indicus]
MTDQAHWLSPVGLTSLAPGFGYKASRMEWMGIGMGMFGQSSTTAEDNHHVRFPRINQRQSPPLTTIESERAFIRATPHPSPTCSQPLLPRRLSSPLLSLNTHARLEQTPAVNETDGCLDELVAHLPSI